MSHLLRSEALLARARCSPWGVACLLSAALLCADGCGAHVEVGEAKDDAGAPAPPATSTSDGMGGQAPVPPPEDCTEADKRKRADYDAWLVLPNAFGSLTGKTFAGYVEGGPNLTLTIDADGSAKLAVGQPAAPPKADLGYLCGDGVPYGSRCEIRYDAPPVEGGVYALHGATFSAGRLLVPIQLNAPYAGWCALQTPHENDVCFFQPIGLDGFTVGLTTGMCTLDGKAVDCDWLELAQLGVCDCTSSACFAAIQSNAPAELDLRFDETTRELSGSFVEGDRLELTLHLDEVSP